MTTATRPLAETVPLVLAVDEPGAGPPILLVHGLGGSSANWSAVAALLAGRRLLVPDLPGHGRSPAPARGATAQSYVGSLARAVRERTDGPALVVGHSFGGLLAARLALAEPASVRGLVLVAAAGVSTSRPSARRYVAVTTRVRPSRIARPIVRRYGDSARLRRALLRPWFVSDADALSRSALDSIFADVHRHTDVAGAGRAMTHDDLRPDVAAITCPTVILWGARDLQLPLADGFELARRMGAPIRAVPDCGHLLPLERPTAVVAAIAEVERRLP